MKTYKITFFLFMSGLSISHAQTEIKTAIGLAAFGKVGLTVERPIIKQLAVEIGADYVGNFGFQSSLYKGLDLNYAGFELMLKPKYYFQKDTKMAGVYVAPFFKYQQTHITSNSGSFDEFQYDYKYGIQPGYKFNFSNIILDLGLSGYYHSFEPAKEINESSSFEVSVNRPIANNKLHLGVVAKLGFRF